MMNKEGIDVNVDYHLHHQPRSRGEERAWERGCSIAVMSITFSHYALL